MPRQQQDVLTAFAQGRDFQVEHVEAVEQVFAECALVDHLFQVAVCGAEDAHIDLDLTLAAHAAESTIA